MPIEIPSFDRIQEGYAPWQEKKETRESAAVRTLDGTKGQLVQYRQHIESLPWNAIVFTQNGARLIGRPAGDDPQSDSNITK